MEAYKEFKAEFDKECPGAYSDAEIEELYFIEIIEPALKQGVKLSKEFLKENLPEGKIWWINKHIYHSDQIV